MRHNWTPEDHENVRQLYDAGFSMRQIETETSLSRASIHRSLSQSVSSVSQSVPSLELLAMHTKIESLEKSVQELHTQLKPILKERAKQRELQDDKPGLSFRKTQPHQALAFG